MRVSSKIDPSIVHITTNIAEILQNITEITFSRLIFTMAFNCSLRRLLQTINIYLR